MIRLVLILTYLIAASLAHADVPGHHPGYMHALSDLHTAIGHLEHRGGSPALQQSDQQAIALINGAVNAISQAAAVDGKNFHYHPRPQGRDHKGGVHRAHQLVKEALRDISGTETNGSAVGAQGQAIQYLNQALQQLDQSLSIRN